MPQMPQGQPGRPRRWLSILFYTFAFALLGYYLFGDKDSAATKELTFTSIQAYIEADAIDRITVYDDNSLKATVKPQKYASVFGERADDERNARALKARIASVDEFSKYIESVNATRKENNQAAIDIKYEKSHD